MTQQEGQHWTERLTRIWAPEKVERYVRYDSSPDAFNYTGYIANDIRLEVEDDDGMVQGQLYFQLHIGDIYITASTYDEVDDGSTYWGREFFQSRKPRIDEWMPFFRRGCWLSGCDIEASAHEKAEWIQGFPREEIQAWNLK